MPTCGNTCIHRCVVWPAVPVLLSGAAAASGAGREKARQPFWRGTLYMSLPGEQPQKLAEVSACHRQPPMAFVGLRVT
jgi:hypothetical protein